jgi:hypothetical protein
MHYKLLIFLLLFNFSFSQTINLNQLHFEENLRRAQLLGKFNQDLSFTIRPIITNSIDNDLIYNLFRNKIKKNDNLIVLPVDIVSKYSFASFYDSKNNPFQRDDDFKIPLINPNNRNDGSLIPARGFQTLLSFGLYAELGPLSIQLKPEYLFSENLYFQRFWTDHQIFSLSRRYDYWNNIDLPERFGEQEYSKLLPGQSSIRFNFNNLSLGISTENLWWGPASRNSIMMSNNARGFPHITFNTTSPLKTSIGNFEWQLITGKLEGSGFKPSYTNFNINSDNFYYKKNDDWRYFQGLILTYSPKYIKGLSIGFIRWAQMYGDFMKKNKDYFPVFENIFRKNDKYGSDSSKNGQSLEQERDQAMGIFFRLKILESNAELYAEHYYNDSKVNLRDLILDSDHSRASTIGFRKIFNKTNINYWEIFWEWTQLEQSSSSLLRNAGSWYHHGEIKHGYTNRGEVLGASIGPGSNSHFISISRINNNNEYSIGFEKIDRNNDFLYYAFESQPYTNKNWKDYNLYLNYKKTLKNLILNFELMHISSKNYEWMDIYNFDSINNQNLGDINNINLTLKIIYIP